MERYVRPSALVVLLAASAACAPEPAPPPSRPVITATSEAVFNAKDIAAYQGDHADVYAHITQNLPSHIANIQRWVRQPSVSALNIGVTEMAEMVRADYQKLGCQESTVVPTSGHPGVFASCDFGAAKTLVVYMMYDVQPVEPADWQSPPFEARLLEHELGTVMMGRGVINQKGPQRAFLNALESIIAVRGKLPVNILFAAEGEEELGSPHYPEVIDKYEAQLAKADGALFPSMSQDPSGLVSVSLGVKGIVYFELSTEGGEQGGPSRAEIHGSFKAIVDSPTWRLVQALSTLTSPDGNTITVPGFYDAIRAPNEEEQRLFNGLLPDWESREDRLRGAMGVSRWIDGWTGRETQLQMLFNTTLNIDGIGSGYTGEGVKTILPHRAVAKVDARLVPDQHPDSILALVRRHLDSLGFTDVKLTKLSGYPPAQSSIEAPFVRAAIGVFNKYSQRVSVAPRVGGSAPYYVFTDRLKLPMIAAGLGYGTGAHAPNEILLVSPRDGSPIAGLADQERFYVDLLYALAEGK